MKKKLLINIVAAYIFFKTRKMRGIVSGFLLMGGDKTKMVARIKELHRNNDGSYKSSNSIITFQAPYGFFRIQHKHGYVMVSYHHGERMMWCYYLSESVEVLPHELIDFMDEAEERLYPEKKPKPNESFWDNPYS